MRILLQKQSHHRALGREVVLCAPADARRLIPQHLQHVAEAEASLGSQGGEERLPARQARAAAETLVL